MAKYTGKRYWVQFYNGLILTDQKEYATEKQKEAFVKKYKKVNENRPPLFEGRIEVWELVLTTR